MMPGFSPVDGRPMPIAVESLCAITLLFAWMLQDAVGQAGTTGLECPFGIIGTTPKVTISDQILPPIWMA
jgi:hypothetical protein